MKTTGVPADFPPLRKLRRTANSSSRPLGEQTASDSKKAPEIEKMCHEVGEEGPKKDSFNFGEKAQKATLWR